MLPALPQAEQRAPGRAMSPDAPCALACARPAAAPFTLLVRELLRPQLRGLLLHCRVLGAELPLLRGHPLLAQLHSGLLLARPLRATDDYKEKATCNEQNEKETLARESGTTLICCKASHEQAIPKSRMNSPRQAMCKLPMTLCMCAGPPEAPRTCRITTIVSGHTRG